METPLAGGAVCGRSAAPLMRDDDERVVGQVARVEEVQRVLRLLFVAQHEVERHCAACARRGHAPRKEESSAL